MANRPPVSMDDLGQVSVKPVRRTQAVGQGQALGAGLVGQTDMGRGRADLRTGLDLQEARALAAAEKAFPLALVKPAEAAAEYEFDGQARATTYGYSIDAPKLKVGTGIGELGLNIKPSPDQALSFDLGLQGYAGKREGVTGSLQVRFEF